jgi:hypothetical protein
MPKVLTVPARESFNVALREYKKSSASDSDDRAHLQRWINDARAEHVWDKIQCAIRSNNLRLPPKRFIIDVLAARRAAMAIGHRGKLRKRYRNSSWYLQRCVRGERCFQRRRPSCERMTSFRQIEPKSTHSGVTRATSPDDQCNPHPPPLKRSEPSR